MAKKVGFQAFEDLAVGVSNPWFPLGSDQLQSLDLVTLFDLELSTTFQAWVDRYSGQVRYGSMRNGKALAHKIVVGTVLKRRVHVYLLRIKAEERLFYRLQ